MFSPSDQAAMTAICFVAIILGWSWPLTPAGGLAPRAAPMQLPACSWWVPVMASLVPPSVGLRAQEGCWCEQRELLQFIKDSFEEAALGNTWGSCILCRIFSSQPSKCCCDLTGTLPIPVRLRQAGLWWGQGADLLCSVTASAAFSPRPGGSSYTQMQAPT